MNSYYVIAAILAVVVAVAACGGGGSSEPATPAAPVAVLFGDSTMAGQGDRLQKALGVAITNQAVSGTQVQQLLDGTGGFPKPLAQRLADFPTARVVLENFGINESQFMTAPETYTAGLNAFVDTVRAAGKVPVIITPSPTFQPADKQQRLAEIVEAARAVAAAKGVALVDVQAEFIGTATPTDLVDIVHPNEAFYQRIVEFEAGRLRPLFSSL